MTDVENKPGAVMTCRLETREAIHMRITGMVKRVETVNRTSTLQLQSPAVHMSVSNAEVSTLEMSCSRLMSFQACIDAAYW